MNSDIYPDLFDQLIRVDLAPYQEKSILEVGYGIYKDFNPKQNQYLFECKHLNTTKTFSRYREEVYYSRENVLFTKEDIYPYLVRKIEHWCKEKALKSEQLIQRIDHLVDGGYFICLRAYKHYLAVEFVRLCLGESYRTPYQVKDSDNQLIQSFVQAEDLLSEFYLFNEADIKRLAVDFNNFMLEH